MLHRVPYNEGAFTLVHVPPVYASAATYSVEDLREDNDSGDRVISSGSATVDSASASVDAASGVSEADRHKVNIDVTAGFSVGKWYWLTENGKGEAFRVIALKANDYLIAEHPMMNDYTTSATVSGLQVSASFGATQANDEDNVNLDVPFRVVWEYDVFGIKRKIQEQIRVVRNTHSDIDQHDAIDLVKTLFPDLPALLPPGKRTLERWCEVAARLLRGDLLARGDDPELFLMGDRGAEALAYKVAMIAAQNGFAPSHREPVEFADDMQRHLNGIWESITRGKAGKETLDLTRTNDQATGSESVKPRPSVFVGL